MDAAGASVVPHDTIRRLTCYNDGMGTTPQHERRAMIDYVYDDGGRSLAGYRGEAGDCVTRAIAIATGWEYRTVYDDLWGLDRHRNGKRAKGPRNGYPIRLVRDYLDAQGWTWTPTMHIGSGCQVHLRADELPAGPLIVRVTRHLCAVIDGVLYDTHDCSRDGTRCVYGYWQPTPKGLAP